MVPGFGPTDQATDMLLSFVALGFAVGLIRLLSQWSGKMVSIICSLLIRGLLATAVMSLGMTSFHDYYVGYLSLAIAIMITGLGWQDSILRMVALTGTVTVLILILLEFSLYFQLINPIMILVA